MKKFSTLALALVLTAALFTGCGCRNNVPPTTMPTTVPTTAATTAPTTHPTTVPTTEHIVPTESTIDHGNGPLEDNTLATNATEGVAEGRARQHVPNNGVR